MNPSVSTVSRENPELRFRSKITLLSFLLSVSVVYLHVCNIEDYGLKTAGTAGQIFAVFELWLTTIQQIAVPCFFMMSGLLFFRTYERSKWAAKLKSRVHSLLIPYLIWNLIPYLLLAVASLTPLSAYFSSSAQFSVSSLFDAFILTKYSVLWFVKYLMVYVLLSPLVYFVIRNKKSAVAVLAGLLTVNLCLLAFDVSIPGITKGIYFSIFYFGGAVMGLHFKDFFCRRSSMALRSVSACVFAAGCIVALICCMQFSDIPKTLPTIPGFLFRLIMVPAFWFTMDLFPLSPEIDRNEFLKMSFPIYCMHDIILEPVEKLVYLLLPRTPAVAITVFVFFPLLVVALICAFAYFFKKLLPRVYAVFYGGRG